MLIMRGGCSATERERERILRLVTVYVMETKKGEEGEKKKSAKLNGYFCH